MPTKIKVVPEYKKNDKIMANVDGNYVNATVVSNSNGKKLKIKFADKEIIEKVGKNTIIYDINKVKKVKKNKNNKNTKNNNNKNNNVNRYNNYNNNYYQNDNNQSQIIKKAKPKDMISPDIWVKPNKKQFPQWINETFVNYKLSKNDKQMKKGKFEAMKYQKFVRDFMQHDSPYRGILLFHGLGSGKTCTAVTASEAMTQNRKVIFISPASLKDNFIHKGLMFCGDPEYKNNPDLIKQRYSFVSSNAPNTVDQLKKLGSLDNKLIVIDEAHNLVSRMVSGLNGNSKQGKEIYQMLISAKNCKIIALTGTPIKNYPYEASVLLNVLKGHIDIHYFRIMGAPTGSIESIVSSLENLDFVDYIDINRSNQTLGFHLLIKSWDPEFKKYIEMIQKEAINRMADIKYLMQKSFPILPQEEEEFIERFVDIRDPKNIRLKNKNMLRRRVLGLVSYYTARQDNYPDLVIRDVIRVPMSKYQFDDYLLVREVEKKSEKYSAKQKKSVLKSKGGKGPQSIMRIYSRQFSNFVFPEDIPRPFAKPGLSIVKIKEDLDKGKSKNKDIIKDMAKEEEIVSNTELSKKYMQRLEKTLKKLSLNKNKYLKDEPGKLQKYSPKMKAILDNIKKSNGLIFVYSQFTSVEGSAIFSMVLEANGYAPFGSDSNKPKFALYSGSVDYKKRKEIIDTFTSSDNKYGKDLKIILASAAGAEGLDLKNIRQIHIMEPYWNEILIKQVIGRGVRRNSHMDLKPDERNVEVFRYLSVFTDQEKSRVSRREQLSTDEYIMEVAMSKEKITNELLMTLKEAAVDCKLNKSELAEDINCFSFGRDAEGLSFLTDISKNTIYNREVSQTREVDIKLILAGLTNNNKIIIADMKRKKMYEVNEYKKRSNRKSLKSKPKIVKKVLVNLMTNTVYDYNQMKKSRTPVKIGIIDKSGKMI